VWWTCAKGPDHEWRTQVYNRTHVGTGCPFCVGKRLSVTNSVAARAPALARWWHPTKNGRRGPADVRVSDTKPVWWKCPEGPDHEWLSAPNRRNRFYRGRLLGCPFCANLRVSVTNSLATRYPKIARFWHPTKNGDVTPEKIVAGTPRPYWWRCDRGHEWRVAPVYRIRGPGNCPHCPRRRRRIAMTWKAPRVRVYLPSDLR
jgi:hypothetical protein